jgi:hypothetical protein
VAILFYDDWKKFPSAIVDIKTKNQSFVRYAGLLKAMGVKNHAFCLALVNPALQGIDPHSKDLTPKEMYMIAEEAKINPWYYLREIVRVPAVAGPEPMPLRANRGNISLFWLFFNHITTMLIQPRQTGKSVSTDSLMTWLFGVATLNTDFNLLTKDNDLRVKNVKRVKDLMEGLPFYFKLKTKKDANNTEKLTLERLGNTYHTSVAQASPKAALNLGRGMTIAINQIDEIAFIKNIHITLPALLAASGAARDSAKAANAPYGNIFTTTPGYLSSESGEFAYKIYNESFKWTEKLFDSENLDKLIDTIKKNSPGKKVQVLLEFNHRQLGFTDEWLRGKIADAMSDGEDAGADFLNLWAEGSSSSPIPKELLKRIKNSGVADPYIEVSKYGYITRWYAPEWEVEAKFANRKLIMSLDTSDAVGNDDIALTIRDAATGEVLGAGVYNETNLITFSEWLVDWVVNYENLTIIIERRSSGVAIIDNLLKLLPIKGIDPFKRIFNWVTNDAGDNPTYQKEVIGVPMNRRSSSVYVKYRKHFGYATSGSGRASRDNLYGEAFNASIKYTGSVVRDKTLIHQLSNLIRKNDRIDHKPGEHDDMVISWLMSYWFLTNAKNKAFYGLDSRYVLSSVTNAIIEEQGGAEEVAKKAKQQRLRQQLAGLITELKSENNKIKTMMITNKIRHLSKDIEASNNQVFDIELLLENIELEKKQLKRAA